jgi:hypothetical protein
MGSKNHITVAKNIKPRGCLSCNRRIFYGDRCPSCQQRLRQRRRRKPR